MVLHEEAEMQRKNLRRNGGFSESCVKKGKVLSKVTFIKVKGGIMLEKLSFRLYLVVIDQKGVNIFSRVERETPALRSALFGNHSDCDIKRKTEKQSANISNSRRKGKTEQGQELLRVVERHYFMCVNDIIGCVK